MLIKQATYKFLKKQKNYNNNIVPENVLINNIESIVQHTGVLYNHNKEYPPPDEILMKQELLSNIRTEIEHITEPSKSIVTARLSGQSFAKIAKDQAIPYNVTVQTFKKEVGRIRKKLHEEYEQ